jgi:hypothetical protein
MSVSIGLDGLLYATFPDGSPRGFNIDVLDPHSLSVLRTVVLNSSNINLDGATADADGNIYGVQSLGGNFYKFNAAGELLKTSLIGISGMHSLAISNTGQLLTATNGGLVILTNTELSSRTLFSVGSEFDTFAGFVTPPIVPEPTSLAWLLITACTLARRRPLL